MTDGDGKENVKNAIGFQANITTWNVQPTFFVHFFAPARLRPIKVPTFYVRK